MILDEILRIEAETKSGNWMVGVNFEQYLWKPAPAADARVGTKKLEFSTSSFGFQEPGLGVFGRAAILPESRNPFSASVSLGLGGRGLLPGRPLDRMGIGGYWLKAVNHEQTTCFDRSVADECYVSEIVWAAAGWTQTEVNDYFAAVGSGPMLIGGVQRAQSYPGFPDFGNLRPAKAFVEFQP